MSIVSIVGIIFTVMGSAHLLGAVFIIKESRGIDSTSAGSLLLTAIYLPVGILTLLGYDLTAPLSY